MTPTQFLALIGLIKDETAPNGNTKTRIGDAILESSKQANTYSTDETVIGTWINGKPIYRIAVEGVMEDIGTYSVFNDVFPMGSVEDIIRHHAFIREVDGQSNVTHVDGGYNGFGVNNQMSFRIDVSSETFSIHSSINTAPSPVIVIFEYTKTTDSIPE